MYRSWVLASVLLASLISVSACTQAGSTAAPSIVVLMVENLGFNSFSCGDASGPPDEVVFESFCNESVRFTHAYTPSAMSQAAIASLLTGVYPREHGVRHNGAVGLSSKFVTLAEVAHDARMKTSFISGGPPIFRRSGFSQGFDLFDDSIGLSLTRLYRPASSVVSSFLDWQRGVRGGSLSFLFFSDLQFVDQPTVDDLGEERESSYEGQVAEVSESIETLVKEMKRRHVWDSTTVILVGTNGLASESRLSEPQAVNLFAEATRVVLMVKPANSAKPEYAKPTNWKIDSNVSLVDLGETLFEMLGSSSRMVSKMGTVSLMSSFANPHPNWNDDRDIVVESAWPVWRNVGGVRSSLRRGPYFYLFDESDQVYNTLTDTLETRALPRVELTKMRDEASTVLRGFGYEPWHVTNRAELERTSLGEQVWRDRPLSAELATTLRSFSARYRDNSELRGWLANVDLQRGDWADLRSIAGKDRPLWTYVAEANLNVPHAAPLADACQRALFTHTGERNKDCGDDLSRALAMSADEGRSKKDRDTAADTYTKLDASKALNDRVSRTNLMVGDVWDVPRGRWSEPQLTDLMLAMPDFRKIRAAKKAK